MIETYLNFQYKIILENKPYFNFTCEKVKENPREARAI